MLTFDFKARDYRTAYWKEDLKQIELSFGRYGQMSIEILQFLWGREWGPMALSLILAEKPECLRVSSGGLSMDSRPGRITVIVDKEGKIEKIEKEIIINLPDGFRCGADVDDWILDYENYVPKEREEREEIRAIVSIDAEQELLKILEESVEKDLKEGMTQYFKEKYQK